MARGDGGGEAKPSRVGRPRPFAGMGLVLKLAVIVVALGAALGLAFGLRSFLGGARLAEKDVSESFVVYIEGLKPAGKLVLLEGVQRYTASRDFTARILALLRLDARIQIDAMADTAYYVDLGDPGAWSASWAPRSGRLVVSAPAPDLLPPAVRTDTIQVRTEGANLLTSTVFQLRKEAEAMKAELSRDMLEQGRKALQTEELRSRLGARLEEVAASFCANVLHVKPSAVVVLFDEGRAPR